MQNRSIGISGQLNDVALHVGPLTAFWGVGGALSSKEHPEVTKGELLAQPRRQRKARYLSPLTQLPLHCFYPRLKVKVRLGVLISMHMQRPWKEPRRQGARARVHALVNRAAHPRLF